MTDFKFHTTQLKKSLKQMSSEEKAKSSRRYFPNGAHCLGVNAFDIKSVITEFHQNYGHLTPEEVLSITEYLLKDATYNEETLLAFGLINKYVKKHYQDDLLLRFEYWLEHYASNWSQVDDLCIKTIYLFFTSRPHLIEQTKHWHKSNISWCRRASSVVWVKFIKRKIGNSVYFLNKSLILDNCKYLIQDTDEFVQKGVGWLLKVTAVVYQEDVITFIIQNHKKMSRHTLRYAIEKMDCDTRKEILAMTK